MDLTFNVPSKGAFTVYFFNYGSGLFFVDDVKLEPIAGCSQAADEQAVEVRRGFVVALEDTHARTGERRRVVIQRGLDAIE